MDKKSLIPFVIVFITGLVSSVATVTAVGVKIDWLRSDLQLASGWIKSELDNHENRILALERKKSLNK